MLMLHTLKCVEFRLNIDEHFLVKGSFLLTERFLKRAT